MKIASIIVGFTFVLYVIIGLSQLWFDILSWDIFIKLSITMVAIIVVTFGIAMLYREYIDEKSMKDENYID